MARKAIVPDIPIISHCHAASFPDSLSSRLGHSFLCQMYTWYFQGDNRFLFLDESGDGHCRGILGGMIRTSREEMGSTSGMIRASKYAAAQALLFRPWLWLSKDVRRMLPIVAKNMFTLPSEQFAASEKDVATREVVEPKRIGIVVIGVDPQYRKQGVGANLLKCFETHALNNHITDLALSVNKHNAGAIAFYEKSGWSIHHDVDDGFHMVKTLAG